eukprot:4724139-Pleurochrysis_carterae.AAC.3
MTGIVLAWEGCELALYTRRTSVRTICRLCARRTASNCMRKHIFGVEAFVILLGGRGLSRGSVYAFRIFKVPC